MMFNQSAKGRRGQKHVRLRIRIDVEAAGFGARTGCFQSLYGALNAVSEVKFYGARLEIGGDLTSAERIEFLARDSHCVGPRALQHGDRGGARKFRR